MICHSERILYKSLSDVVKIKPLADLHIGNAHCDERKARAWIDKDPSCYFVGNGDLMDMVIASDAKRYRKSSDGTEGDDIVDEQIDKLYRWLEPHKDRILGLGTGNHEDAITKHSGTNPTKRLCQMLGCKFLGYSWLLKVTLSAGGQGGRSIVIRGHHGWGGGSRTLGADLTKYSKDMSYWDADVYLYGHVHKRQTDVVPRLGLAGQNNKLVVRDQLIGITGTFLKTYSNTPDPTYAEIKGYPPVGLGGLVLNIKPQKPIGVKMWFDN